MVPARPAPEDYTGDFPGFRMIPRVCRLLAVGAATSLLWPVLLDAQARERVAFVSVVERATNQPVNELAPADVIVREDGVRREVLRVTRASGPMHIAVLVDDSAAANQAIPDIRAGLTRLFTALGDLGPVALITMGDRPTRRSPTTPPTRRCSPPASAGSSRGRAAGSPISTPCSRPPTA